MPVKTDPWPVGAPCWTECAFAPEHRGMHHAKDFYEKLFGWRIDHGENGSAVCLKEEQPVAALVGQADESQPSLWAVHLACQDVSTTVAAVQEAGGRLLGSAEQPGTAWCADPTGAVFGLRHIGEHTAYGLVGEPGCVAHHSLLTRDVAAAKAFYARVFGYAYDDESSDHASIRLADGSRGGSIHLGTNLPDEAPATWLVHFAVADRDSSAQIAQELGATILMTFDSPSGPEAVLQGEYGEVFNLLALPD